MMTVDPQTLTSNLGGFWYRSYGVAPCPVCQPEKQKHQNALSIGSDGGRLLLHCKKYGCDFRAILSAAGVAPGQHIVDEMARVNAEAARAEQAAKTKARARSLWERSQPVAGTHGETYLRGRGITCPIPETLRWLPDVYHGPSGRYCSAIVADVSTGGVHRTFFTKKGQRLDKSAKMMLGPCAGGAVCLSGSDGPLVVCEGIETGLSLLSGILVEPATVWAALSAPGIKAVKLPDAPSQLVIATDGDPVGHEAGQSLAERAHRLGWNVSTLPAPAGQDWNDVVAA